MFASKIMNINTKSYEDEIYPFNGDSDSWDSIKCTS